MTISMVLCNPSTQPIINVPCNGPKLINAKQKEKVVLVMGATGTGKSRLSIDLGTCFPSEIINSDKIQAYEGLEIATNKVTKEEQRGVPHHLLGIHNLYSEFTANDFCDMASLAMESIIGREQLPIIVGGSNSYVEALVERFGSRYDWFFLWLDVSMPILHSYVSKRVDEMVEKGMVNELRPFFSPNGDYSKGIRKAIGVPEFDMFFRSEGTTWDERTKQRLFDEAIRGVKKNTCTLACKQFERIERLRNVKRWNMQRVCATRVFEMHGNGDDEADEAWRKIVAEPSARLVAQFLYNEAINNNNINNNYSGISSRAGFF
ncbi:hypothetical protein HN51_015386 [Arachis hypogaea]|uniref:adenylate dimethylallyltransferase (ADP/ATP-dependent) n=3 Tax=Arachis hypogaea TaxID=3818 RepID=A0A445CKV3_ARAHY|nr:adenylate isopentenyltransferase 5, chloroplastic-like [Arachis hypogaea]QHO44563.1 Adenylate isopentenyltransferase 5 [Arachis hypogaea]RYR51523.1 hypothetical protein Ahy_A06g026544 isoform A [Arachis hypogaea]